MGKRAQHTYAAWLALWMLTFENDSLLRKEKPRGHRVWRWNIHGDFLEQVRLDHNLTTRGEAFEKLRLIVRKRMKSEAERQQQILNDRYHARLRREYR